MQERPPSRSTDRKIGKRRPLGAPPWCVPASPKTCRLCRARRASRLTASWNGRLAVTVAVLYARCTGPVLRPLAATNPSIEGPRTPPAPAPLTPTRTPPPRISPQRGLHAPPECPLASL